MATWTYDESLRRLLGHEGGYSNHPSDPGGPTNFGITIHDYRKYIKASGTAADVRAMKLADAKKIYKSKYWDALNCDNLPPGVDYAVFDYGVNSGIGRSGKVLRRVIGIEANTHIVTAAVIEAVNRRNAASLINVICDERMRFLQSLRTWPVFGTGWGRRVKEVRAASHAMNGRGAPKSAEVKDPQTPAPGRGQVPENKAAKEAIRTGVPAGGAVTGLWFVDWIAAHPVQTAVIAAFIFVGVVFAIHALRKARERKQETPMLDTPIVSEVKL